MTTARLYNFRDFLAGRDPNGYRQYDAVFEANVLDHAPAASNFTKLIVQVMDANRLWKRFSR